MRNIHLLNKAIFALLFLILFVGCSKKEIKGDYIIFNVSIIDVDSGTVIPNQTVVISGNRIKEIIPYSPKDVLISQQTIDGSQKYLMPGLWDMHVHAGKKENFLPLCIANGVTGVRDLGGNFNNWSLWKKEINEGRLLGPRIVLAGHVLDGPKPEWPNWDAIIALHTKAQVADTLDYLKKINVDFIKVYHRLPKDLYYAISEKAKTLQIPFVGHVPYSISALEASEAGQKCLEHMPCIMLACSEIGNELSSKINAQPADLPAYMALIDTIIATYSEQKASNLFAALKKNNTWVDPTLAIFRSLAYADDPSFTSDSRLKYVPQSLVKGWQIGFPENGRTAEEKIWWRKNINRNIILAGILHKNGVRLLAGSDVGGPYLVPGFSLHDELQLLVAGGLSPFDALRTATIHPAEFLGIQDSIGSVATGKVADLILLNENPFVDIKNTQKIEVVIRNGKILNRSFLDNLLLEVEKKAIDSPPIK